MMTSGNSTSWNSSRTSLSTSVAISFARLRVDSRVSRFFASSRSASVFRSASSRSLSRLASSWFCCTRAFTSGGSDSHSCCSRWRSSSGMRPNSRAAALSPRRARSSNARSCFASAAIFSASAFSRFVCSTRRLAPFPRCASSSRRLRASGESMCSSLPSAFSLPYGLRLMRSMSSASSFSPHEGASGALGFGGAALAGACAGAAGAAPPGAATGASLTRHRPSSSSARRRT
ncbi:MAG: hypothetical protein BWZ09_02721 [Alphaproteobacteria bacterium ADurb.BinA305]|nr:MAG: hypothetical protein BWZ09_02721 [Alphaproteobacteria bacterium ADurb.BinA305]